MGLNVVFPPSLRRMAESSPSVAPGLSLCTAPGVRRMASLSWSALVTMIFMRKFRVIVSRVNLHLSSAVLLMARPMYYLVPRACMATSLHFLSRMLSSLTA